MEIFWSNLHIFFFVYLTLFFVHISTLNLRILNLILLEWWKDWEKTFERKILTKGLETLKYNGLWDGVLKEDEKTEKEEILIALYSLTG